jgi:putative ABC transport system permease protein
VISRYTARQHHLGTGATIRLPTPGGMRQFRVAGIFDDVVSFDSMFMDYSVYARIWRDSAADMFAVYPRPGYRVGAVQDHLGQIIKGLGVPAEVDTKQRTIDKLLRVVDGTFSLASALQFAALVVALLVVANTMLTAVVERRWEFSLTRAIGMSPARLRRLVLVEAAGIGILGSAVALLIGPVLGGFMVLTMNERFGWAIEYRLAPLSTALTLASGIALAALAGLLPSHVASRVPIIKGLQLE